MGSTSLTAPKKRRKASIVPLIDVVFLLLKFFLLTTTFSKLGEIELTGAIPGAPSTVAQAQVPPVFLRLTPEALTLNTEVLPLDGLAETLRARADEGAVVLISMTPEVESQRLVDILSRLQGLPFGVQVLQ